MNQKKFYDTIRPMFGNRMTETQVSGCQELLSVMGHLPIPEQAYILATDFHETGQKMQPVVESLTYSSPERIRKVWPTRFRTLADAKPYVKNPKALANKVYNGRMGNIPGSDDGWNFRGRGDVQITGRSLYAFIGKLIGVDLVSNPDAALNPTVSKLILVRGCSEGWFTGSGLNNHIDGIDESDAEDLREFINARRTVNGTDAAGLIADYAMTFEKALRAAVEAAPSPDVATPVVKVDPAPEVALAPLAQGWEWATFAGIMKMFFDKWRG